VDIMKDVAFVVDRETKNTIRYAEKTDGQPPKVKTIYIEKWALGETFPRKVKVTIETAE